MIVECLFDLTSKSGNFGFNEEEEMEDQRAGTSEANVESISTGLTRRRILQGAGGLIAAAALPSKRLTIRASPLRQESAKPSATPAADLTGQWARYMVEARDQTLPPNVALEGKHHILDTLGAMVSGSRLKPGEMAIAYVRAQGGVPESSVIGTNVKTSAINAALANGMCGHADETDDVELVTKTHPGCLSVAAALATAAREGRVRATQRSGEGVGPAFSAGGAAAPLARLDEAGMRYALSYAAQQVSGLWSWVEDPDHIEKAFDIGGMGARNGVTAVTMVQAGFTGVRDVLSGRHNALEALSSQPHPEAMVADLGSRFFVQETGIKTYSVGYPNQAPLDAFLQLRREFGLRADNVERIVVALPEDGPGIVSNSPMPNVNCQYLLATALVDGAVSFANSHSREHMDDPRIRAVMQRVQV